MAPGILVPNIQTTRFSPGKSPVVPSVTVCSIQSCSLPLQNEVIFSQASGFLNNPFSLTLSGNSGSQVIRYTIDGSSPSNNSSIYSSPIAILNNTSVRAAIFSENYLPSPVKTESYIINSNHEIDVILISIDPYDLAGPLVPAIDWLGLHVVRLAEECQVQSPSPRPKFLPEYRL